MSKDDEKEKELTFLRKNLDEVIEENKRLRGEDVKNLYKSLFTLTGEVAKLSEERSGLHILVEMLRKEVEDWLVAKVTWEQERDALTREINELMEDNMKLREGR